MNIANPSKALLALAAMICITVLLAVERIPTEAGTGLLGSLLGYVIGNGVGAKQGVPIDPIIGRKSKP
jgi:hypothetical protein